MNTKHRIPLFAVAASLAVMAAASLSGCSALAGESAVGHLVLENKAEAVAEHIADVPEWVPDDAVAISLDYSGEHHGYLLSFGSQQGVAASGDCAPDASAAAAAPMKGWPAASQIEARLVCGTAHVVRTGTDWFAWVQR